MRPGDRLGAGDDSPDLLDGSAGEASRVGEQGIERVPVEWDPGILREASGRVGTVGPVATGEGRGDKATAKAASCQERKG